ESTPSVSVPDHIARQVVLPEGHREDEPLFAAYQWLRENAPLAKVHVEGYDPLWLVAKHADIMEIEKQPAAFPSGGGAKPGSHNPILQNQAGDAFTMSLTGGSLRILEAVTYLDPPEHTMVRNIASERFRPASLKKWEDRIRELAREAIAARLMLLYQSANRDADAFEAPGEFRIDRKPNRQIAFGYGPHMCVGQHLSRLELRVMLDELLPRLVWIEITGDRKVAQTNCVGGLRRLPMRLELA